jgi:hypothetical protein
MDSNFFLICGGCFSKLPEKSGHVLSCGDFLCEKCSQQFPSSCPLCNKQDVAKLSLGSENLPDEVSRKVEDVTSLMEKLHGTIEFQFKSYKRLIKKLAIERSQQNLYKAILSTILFHTLFSGKLEIFSKKMLKYGKQWKGPNFRFLIEHLYLVFQFATKSNPTFAKAPKRR